MGHVRRAFTLRSYSTSVLSLDLATDPPWPPPSVGSESRRPAPGAMRSTAWLSNVEPDLPVAEFRFKPLLLVC
jgi:hypothetical protein